MSQVPLARTVGLLPQDSIDPFPCNVLETALIGRHPHLRTWQWETERDHAVARATLAQVGLNGLEHRQVATLSGGERRPLALATLLMQHAQQGGVMMTLHDINLAARFCDHLLMLFGDGKALAGPPISCCKKKISPASTITRSGASAMALASHSCRHRQLRRDGPATRRNIRAGSPPENANP